MRPICFLALLFLAACTRAPQAYVDTAIYLTPAWTRTRANDPDEERITDYNLLIFNSFGILEEKVFLSRRQLVPEGGEVCHRTRLLQDVPYTILAAANLGMELPCRTLEEALSYRYYMAYPDEFTPGMPMTAVLKDAVPGNDGRLQLPLQRLMARIDLRIDRRALDNDVQFTVREVSVGGCPSSACLFSPSKAESSEQIFQQGYVKYWSQVSALNQDTTLGISGPVSVYLLENIQGELLEHVTTDRGKVFSDGRYQEVCSYIEIKAEYHSPSLHSRAGEYLIYRFYLGESLNDFSVRRNVLYSITVRPEKDGLQEDSWRVDSSGLEGNPRFELHPAAYNECRSGEDFHIWCEVEPPGFISRPGRR